MIKYSTIIPVLNEEEIIVSRLKVIKSFIGHDSEIIVVDGGSQDNTIAAVESMGVNVYHAERGRGAQCNIGAQKASGDILLFLHIDTQLPIDAFHQIDRLFADRNVQISTFRLTFDTSHRLLKLYAFFTRFDSILTTFGDQCIIVRKSFFDSINGFPPWPFLEDVHFLRSARKRAKIFSLPGPVITSARMFLRRGILRQQILNGSLIFQYLLGTDPEKLYRQYYACEKPS